MPCLNVSSHRSRLPYLRGLKSASSAARLRWILMAMMGGFLALVLGCASGCGRAVLIRESDPMRAGPSFKGKVYTLIENEWRLTPNEVEIPEGWYLVPPSYVETPHP